MYLNPSDDTLSWRCFLNRGWESLEVQKVRESIIKGSICINIGANIGIYTLIMSEEVGYQGKVIAFEPDPESFGYLRKNTKDRKNVVMEKIAITNKTGDVPFFIYSGSRGKANSSCFSGEIGNNKQEITVKSQSLGSYVTNNRIAVENISVIVIDTEGAEPYIMNDIGKMLQSMKNATIFVEYSPSRYVEQGIDMKAYEHFLFNNFRVFNLNNRENSFAKITALEQFDNLGKTDLMLEPKEESK